VLLLLTERLLVVPVALFLPVLATLRDDDEAATLRPEPDDTGVDVEEPDDATLREEAALTGLDDEFETLRPELVPVADTRPLELRLRFLSHPPLLIRRLGVNEGVRSTYTTLLR